MDTVVTNGHNVLGMNRKHLVDVVITAGHDSNHPETQRGAWAAVSGGWYAYLAKDCDLALIRLASPFKGAAELEWVPTPPMQQGSEMTCDVLGLLWAETPNLTRSPGRCTLDDASGMRMIRHSADTDRGKWAFCIKVTFSQANLERTGSSGSALLQGDTVIGVHRGYNHFENEAVVLDRGRNNLDEFRKVLDWVTGGPMPQGWRFVCIMDVDKTRVYGYHRSSA
ncbi:uncharacterized protein E0L32_005265 [Thyridium curvatum]|uniref:Peptidase S1 domain-containing protein n=1 Tax=Thyridium curvatum TaxID=1093900 RepID=A0A507B404_9PEZI|nr:uncharacterized protein E0L32_005265 [Thyridium curvatum]TPX14573.1 hypothetical protein E0L32_005265 [Thyridium curvatum]